MCYIAKLYCEKHGDYVDYEVKTCKENKSGKTCEATGKAESELKKFKRNVICDECVSEVGDDVGDDESQASDEYSYDGVRREVRETRRSSRRGGDSSSSGRGRRYVRTVPRHKITAPQMFLARMCGLVS